RRRRPHLRVLAPSSVLTSTGVLVRYAAEASDEGIRDARCELRIRAGHHDLLERSPFHPLGHPPGIPGLALRRLLRRHPMTGAIPPAHARRLDEEGYVRLEGFIAPDRKRRLVETIDALFA